MLPTVDQIKDVLLSGIASVMLASLSSTFGFTGFYAPFVPLWVFFASACFYMSSLKVPVADKCVLITGCDTGFGHHLALHLHSLGFLVFAGCLKAEATDGEGGGGADFLRNLDPERLRVLQLDVTKPEQLTEAFAQVKNDLLREKKSLWGIVNNAGVSVSGEAEWVSLEAFRRVLEVNYLGVVAATKTFLPLLRQSKGRVVNVSSMLGRMAPPMGSAYISSKFAIEGFSDCLRKEVRKWGIHVSIIEPGNLIPATQISPEKQMRCETEAMWASMDSELKDKLGRSTYDTLLNALKIWKCSGLSDVSIVIDAMTDALTQRFPRVRYLPMEIYNWICVLLANHLPEFVFDSLCHLLFSFLYLSCQRRGPTIKEKL